MHTPPGWLVRWALERMADGTIEVDRGIDAHFPHLPGLDQRIANRRNWLSLEIDDETRIWASWRFEGMKGEAQHFKVIHPVA